jgi:hypothetical protein
MDHKQFLETIHQASAFCQPMAYFWVQLRAVDSYFDRSVLYMWAISGTRGSSGLGSVSREQMESKTCETFKQPTS